MMFKNLKKHLIITNFIFLLILFILPSINADIIKSNFLNLSLNRINILKIDSKGQISPIKLITTQLEDNNIELTIAQKLQDLCKNDIELQRFIKTNSLIPWVEVESIGYGFHKTSHRIYLANRSILWRYIIRYSFCNDSDYTKGKFKGNEEWLTITGHQNIRLVGFIGYVYFKPNYLLSRFKIHEIIIYGYTLRIDKLK